MTAMSRAHNFEPIHTQPHFIHTRIAICGGVERWRPVHVLRVARKTRTLTRPLHYTIKLGPFAGAIDNIKRTFLRQHDASPQRQAQGSLFAKPFHLQHSDGRTRTHSIFRNEVFHRGRRHCATQGQASTGEINALPIYLPTRDLSVSARSKMFCKETEATDGRCKQSDASLSTTGDTAVRVSFRYRKEARRCALIFKIEVCQ
jgi:hypothetical protein